MSRTHISHQPKALGKSKAMPRYVTPLCGVVLSALALSACSAVEPGQSEESAEVSAQTDSAELAVRAPALSGSCGYRVEAERRSRRWRDGYHGVLELTNVSGSTAREFEVVAFLGGAQPERCAGAECSALEDGFLFTSRGSTRHDWIRRGETHRMLFSTRDEYAGIKPYVISINGVKCDGTAPQVSLVANQTLFTSNGTLELVASASDDVAVRKVVFRRDGVTLAVDTRAPYTLRVPADEVQNGRHRYTATAYDPSGNEATSNSVGVLTSIGDKFFGTAPDNTSDYTHLLAYFDQLTPANAGKWGSVEATRDQMDWTKLDAAYAFARSNGLRFKLHTLIWGQQQPSWLEGLSAAEQLAEIEQWMALAAQRYPDVDLVDVVNEPLHAVPTYSAALGGPGVTGWDWVIKAFELARKYFPRAELLVNDYNVEALDSFATDYLAVIDVLNQRGLVDGIGIQAHFLERAELSVIGTSLDRFAATGLPIYVSELDINFANDARHAQRMRELFTLFWQHPAVLGVTHWGHLQGGVWRRDSYLVRTDGSPRPALDWIQCFRAGGVACPVPEYTPDPRVGDASSITLQAEDYDAASGVVALGDVVAYTDDGDWQSFSRVRFNEAWNTLSVTYAKGNEEPGNLTVYLGGPDSTPIATIALEPTGAWGTSKTLTVPITPISTADDQEVYVRFNGGTGVGNIDRFRFGVPLGAGANLVENGSFESGSPGWFTWNGSATTTTTRAHTGASSLMIAERTGNAPAATNLTSLVTPGTSYEVSFWVSIGGVATADVNLTRKIVCNGEESYSWLASPTPVADGAWLELQGTLDIPQCDSLSEVLVYAEGPGAGIDLYVDDVKVIAPGLANSPTP